MDQYVITSSVVAILEMILAPEPINTLGIARRLRMIAPEVGAHEYLIEALDGTISLLRRERRQQATME
jgi:hypothetical protein